MIETTFHEQAIDEGRVDDGAVNESGTGRNVVDEPARQIVEDGDLMPATHQRVGDVGPDESRTSGDQHSTHAASAPSSIA